MLLTFHLADDCFHRRGRLTIQHHLELAGFHLHHERLFAHPAHHVERRLRLSPQGQFLDVVLNTLLNDLPERLLNDKEPIRRTHALQTLMGPLVVVVFHPQPDALPRLLEGGELRTAQELLPDRLPEPLDLAQCHRVMRLAADVVDVVLLEFHLEPRLASPRGILPPVVGEHFLGHAVFGHGAAIEFQHVLAGLAAEQLQPDQIARVVIHEANQIRLLAAEPDGANVALP